MHKIDTGQTPFHDPCIHSHSTAATLCNSLYLTSPGKLWSNHTNVSRVLLHPNDYAIHVPTQPTSAHLHHTWSIWTGEQNHSSFQEQITSSERIQHQHANEAFGTSKTDRILDEYIKTVPAILDTPTRKTHYETPSESTLQSLALSRKLLNEHATAADIVQTVVSTNATSNPSPLHILQRINQLQKKMRQCHKNSKPVWSHSFKTVAYTHQLSPYPHRAKTIQRAHTMTSKDILMRSTSSNPWNVAASTTEQIELLLECFIPLKTKSNDYKKATGAIRRFVRELLTRGTILSDWYTDLREHDCDLHDITPGADQLARRQAYHYMTPKRLISCLSMYTNRENVDKSEIHYLLMLHELQNPRRWHNQQMQHSTMMNLYQMHQLMQSYTEEHSSERDREILVRSKFPNARSLTEENVRRYAQRYEQLVRMRLMNDSAIRKDDSILSVFYTLHNLPTSKKLTALFTCDSKAQLLSSESYTQTPKKKKKNVVKCSTAHSRPQPTSSRRMKTLHLSLNASDRVPQSINVIVKRKTTSSPEKQQMKAITNLKKQSTTAETKEATTVSAHVPQKKVKQNADQPSQNKKTVGGKANAKEKTITLTTQPSLSKTQQPHNGQLTLQITKTKTVPSSRGRSKSKYLTTDEIDTYRDGLRNYIKHKGGASFVQSEQQKQKRKTPGFHFDHVIDNKNHHHSSITKKLPLSAKNRNALREVKREVLKLFGSNRTFKNVKKANKQINGKGFIGSMYTRKSAGGSAMDSVPVSTSRVSWKENDSLGSALRDESMHDMKATDGMSSIDLSLLEEVVID